MILANVFVNPGKSGERLVPTIKHAAITRFPFVTVRIVIQNVEQFWEVFPDPWAGVILIADGVDTNATYKFINFSGRHLADTQQGLSKVGGTSV